MLDETTKRSIKNQLLWITTLGQASVALYLPALPGIAKELGISPALAGQSITAYIFGFGVSPFFYGPISDRVGRRPVLVFSLCLALVGYLINIGSDRIQLFILARLVQGLGCGGLLIVGRTIVRDVFEGRELSSAASYLSMGFSVGFGLSPVVGGLLVGHGSWRYNFVVLVALTLTLLVVAVRRMPETLDDGRVARSSDVREVAKDYAAMLGNARFLRFTAGGFCAYGVVLAYNVMTPFLFQNAFGFSAKEYAYLAPLIGLPYFAAATVNRTLALRYGGTVVSRVGSALVVLAGVLLLVSTVVLTPSVPSVVVPMAIASFGQAFVFSNTISGAMQSFPPDRAGKASSLFSGMQMLLASGLSAVMAQLPNATPLALGGVLFGLGVGAFLLLPKSTGH